jgi:hypothetical protein
MDAIESSLGILFAAALLIEYCQLEAAAASS